MRTNDELTRQRRAEDPAMRMQLAGGWKDPHLKTVYWWAWGAGFMSCIALEVIAIVWWAWWVSRG